MNRRLAPLASLLLIAAAGCGGEPVGKVAGTVTLADQPLGTGAIVFENAESGLSFSANLNADGTYKLRTAEADGLPPGVYLVSVRPGVIGTGETPLAGSEDQAANASTSAIPIKYHRGTTSGLTADVAAGENPPFEFELAR